MILFGSGLIVGVGMGMGKGMGMGVGKGMGMWWVGMWGWGFMFPGWVLRRRMGLRWYLYEFFG